MQLSVNVKTITITRPHGAPRAKTESHFWHQLKRALYDQRGETWCKLRNTGQLGLTSMPYVLRNSRGWRKDSVLIIDNHYAIRCPAQEYNLGNSVTLHFHFA